MNAQDVTRVPDQLGYIWEEKAHSGDRGTFLVTFRNLREEAMKFPGPGIALGIYQEGCEYIITDELDNSQTFLTVNDDLTTQVMVEELLEHFGPCLTLVVETGATAEHMKKILASFGESITIVVQDQQ